MVLDSQHRELKHLHALHLLLPEQWKVLKKIETLFRGQWSTAWASIRLASLLPPASRAVWSKINPEKEWEELQKHELTLLTPQQDDYPLALKNIADPPFLLYTQGSTAVLKKPSLAVVGTRQFTGYGQRATFWLVEKIARAGLTIISGLARGIDGFAHQAALKAGGTTIAVLGGGIGPHSIIYDHRRLAKEIISAGGAIISEYPPAVHGSKTSFPQRNRIVSGLALGTLVVEAGEQSGSLITARLALEQNREVFALPGPVFSRQSQGPNNLLKLGAKPVTNADDILTELGFSSNNTAVPLPLFDSPLEQTIARIIAAETRTADEIVRLAKHSASEVTACLMKMELEDKVRNLGQNRFSLT